MCPQLETALAARRVVIVEDNDDTREMLRALMVINGHEVFIAEDGEQGLALIQRERPNLAIIDIGLPKLDGYQLVSSLRSRPDTRDLFLVALTGYGQPEDRRRAMDAGFNEYLVKPLRFDELKELLGLAAA